MKRVFVLALMGLAVLFSGCVVNSGPITNLMLHGEINWAKVTYNFKKIDKKSKIYMEDLTQEQDPYVTGDNAYSMYISNVLECSAEKEMKKALKKSGYAITDDIKRADYLVFVESLGCGRWGEIKKYIHTPKAIAKELTKKAYSADIQNGLSFVSLGSTLSDSGHSGAAGVSTALGVLSVLGSRPDKLFKMLDAITVIDKKSKKVEQSIYYVTCHGKTFSELLTFGREQIANKFIMEIDW